MIILKMTLSSTLTMLLQDLDNMSLEMKNPSLNPKFKGLVSLKNGLNSKKDNKKS